MLISLAIDFHHSDVATRERFHPGPDRVAQLYEHTREDGIEEQVLIVTCNRSELYAWLPAPLHGSALDQRYATIAKRWMGTRAGARALLGAAVRRDAVATARHLLRVAAGLESQILGDGQILGQLRAAYKEASDAGAAGSVLHRLFDTALRAGKRVQAETTLSIGRSSVGAEAAALTARRFGNLARTRIVVVGAGKTGHRVSRQLVKLGARDLVLVNRTAHHVEPLAAEVHGRRAAFEALHCELAMADVAIVATASGEMIVHAESLAAARRNCGTDGAPLLIVDLAMPRNVDPAVAALGGVTLLDLDALHVPVAAAEDARRTAVPLAEIIVDVELQVFHDWVAAMAARVAIRPLHDALVDVCRREVAFASGDALADRTADRIVAKLIARPMSAVRRALARGEPIDDLTRALTELFASAPLQPTTRHDGPAALSPGSPT